VKGRFLILHKNDLINKNEMIGPFATRDQLALFYKDHGLKFSHFGIDTGDFEYMKRWADYDWSQPPIIPEDWIHPKDRVKK